MALSFDVNLTFTSFVGYRRVSGSIIGAIPQIQTIHTLEGQDITPLPYPPIPMLRVEPLNNFVFQPNTTSTSQTVRLTNIGGYVLTVTNVLFSFYDVVPIAPRSSLGLPITIQPGTTSTFNIQYYAVNPGLYKNYFTIISNNVSGPYRVITSQNVGYSPGFTITPNGYTTSTSRIGENLHVTYDLKTTSTDPAAKDVIPTSTSMTGSQGWTVSSTGTNFVSANFNPNVVNNATGTYVSTLTVSSNGVSYSVVNTATISIDRTANKNLSTWLSPASRYNSIVGISYDLKDNRRYLTIGVGTGADGSEIYGLGGSSTIALSTLGLGAESLSSPYTYWSKVYNIPFSTGTNAQTYLSKDYVVKTTTASDYSSYFGQDRSNGSMFLVEEDGYGSIKVEMNYLRDILSTDTVDSATTATLYNLTRAFHYYSNVDMLGRYAPLPTAYSNPIVTDTSTTYLFVGFNYNTRDKLANTNTSIVALPL